MNPLWPVLFATLALFSQANAQSQHVEIYAANTLDIACGTPSEFMSFVVTSTLYSPLWGNCNNEVIYSPHNNSLDFDCMGPNTVCETHTSSAKISYSLGSVSLEKLDTTGCTISYFSSLNQPNSASNYCYAEWICINLPPTAVLSNEQSLQLKLFENTKEHLTRSKI